MRRMIVAIENLMTLDGRVITETVLPTGWVPVVADRNSEEAKDQLVIGILADMRREPAPDEVGVEPGPMYLTGVPNFNTTRFVGLAPQAEFDGGTTAPARTANGLDFQLYRGPRLRAVVLGRRPAWPGLEIRR